VGNIPHTALGAVLATLFAAVLSLLSLIISKENKTSEFRQAWIDALRSDFASLIGHLNAIHGTVKVLGTLTPGWQEAREDIIGINRCAASIRLRLNPAENLSKAIFARLDEIEQRLRPSPGLSNEELNEMERALLGEAQSLLKQEWLVVRRGELSYRIARIAALIISVLGAVGIAFWVIQTRT
jgi:hypothetical protein